MVSFQGVGGGVWVVEGGELSLVYRLVVQCCDCGWEHMGGEGLGLCLCWGW